MKWLGRCSGFDVYAERCLNPRWERTHFSGGFNNSAMARNKAKAAEHRKAYVMQDKIILPQWCANEVFAQLQKATS